MVDRMIQNVLKKIQDERIAPVSWWRFWLFRGFGWGALGLSILLAGLFTASSLHIISESDWEAYTHTQLSWYQAFLLSAPFLWLGFLGVFLILAIILGRLTRHGYRYPLWGFLILFLGTTALLGYAVERSPYDDPVEKFFMGAVANHDSLQKIIPSADGQWEHPEAGLLGGEIREVNEKAGTMEVEDHENKTWIVEYKKAQLEGSAEIKPHSKINIIGSEDAQGGFEAKIIRKPKSHESWKEKKGDATVKGATTKEKSYEDDDNEEGDKGSEQSDGEGDHEDGSGEGEND